MADNRLYIVDTSTGEYLMIAKLRATEWIVGNIELYSQFLTSRLNENFVNSNLVMGHENDSVFYEKWLHNGDNYNKHNLWKILN